jgi:7-cyano-7-deazaguanine synthase in queuosine biosynthesis
MNTFNFICGGATPDSDADEAGKNIRLDVQGDLRNVNLKIEDISKAMVSNIPDVLLDLLEVASYVYCADQQSRRGTEVLAGYGKNWRRVMNFTIPLRDPERWQSEAVINALCETLGFLSEDSYAFSFVKAEKPLAEKEMYFPGLSQGTFDPNEIALFSGGVDSFSGAVRDLVQEGKKLVLVGHHSANAVFNVQKELIEGLKQGGLANQIFYVPINVTNTKVKASEYTQRTRSFLFACLALVVAQMFKKDEFTFYENGVVSLNIPIAKDVLGARATRTTHPKVIRGFEELFSEILDKNIEIRTPFQWFTKKEVTQIIPANGFGHLLGKTNSCTRPRTWTKKKHHCGACSQCIDRRFAILAAGLEDLDPGDSYKLDLLLGDRSQDRDVRMALAYVKFFQTFSSSTKDRFLSTNPQITPALGEFSDLSADEARDRVYELYMRHSLDVVAVIEDGLVQHKGKLAQGGEGLPAGALLSMCLNRSQITVAPPSDYDAQAKGFMDRLAAPILEFAVDERSKHVLFHNGLALEGANFKLVENLLANFRSAKRDVRAIEYITASDLAGVLDISEPALRTLLRRLRSSLEPLATDLGILLDENSFIENRHGKGYRLNPNLREIALADIKKKGPPPTEP